MLFVNHKMTMPQRKHTKVNKQKRERGGASIPCPICKGPTRVKQTRRNDNGTVRRERTCLKCHIDFNTNEMRQRRAA